jgi:cytidyltransferase-like protein
MKYYKKGLIFGKFEFLHDGHLNLIERAGQLCEKLIVCVSDEEYISKHYGKLPIQSTETRRRIIGSLKFVDEVGVQTLEFGKKEAIKLYKPDNR